MAKNITRIRKPKQNIKPKQKWKHSASGGVYEVISKTRIKIPHVGWFWGVTYLCENGRKYTRFVEDFENKFEKL